MKQAGSYRWDNLAEHLPSSTQHHVETIVGKFYRSFDSLSQSGVPRIGNWSPKLRFFHTD